MYPSLLFPVSVQTRFSSRRDLNLTGVVAVVWLLGVSRY